MITLTLEEKTQFFAIYWGQDVGMYKNAPEAKSVDWENIEHYEFLELKHLSSIDDDTSIEVAKMFGATVDQILSSPEDLKNISSIFSQGIEIYANYVKPYIYQQIIDHLRSKGYNVGWKQYSPQDLIGSGIVKTANP